MIEWSIKSTTRQINHLNLEQRKWFQVNDDVSGTYNGISQIKFKTALLKSNLCDYNDVYILAKKTITVTKAGADTVARHAGKRNERVRFKNSPEINNTKVDNAISPDFVNPIYDLIGYSNNYAKKISIFIVVITKTIQMIT